MSELTYWTHRLPHPDDEWLGRRLKNAFSIEETIEMQVCHWKYFDWLAEQGSDMEQWVKDADMNRHYEKYTLSLSSQLIRSLVYSERRRIKKGQPCPQFIDRVRDEDLISKNTKI